jgi:hypothetical protein
MLFSPQNILDAEPELDDLDHSFLCPVCLDLLFEPHKVVPCQHLFCEPCLRRLGSKNPMNTSWCRFYESLSAEKVFGQIF